MLFNSYLFLFIFFPIFLVALRFARHYGKSFSVLVALSASLIFYAYPTPYFLIVLLLSILFNYTIASLIESSSNLTYRKIYLYLGVVGDVCILSVFKYTNFFLNNINALFQAHIPSVNIVLPLGISFFTFTQIAYVVDVYQKKSSEVSFLRYALFVSYFPHLIAGPIIHHSEVMPQFKKATGLTVTGRNLVLGLTYFGFGLFKKVVIADSLGLNDMHIFAHTTEQIDFFSAWFSVLSYSLQLYFDFSGYSDMAIGLSKVIGIKLPINFNSPYKAVSIVDFWRRWNMTLSRFLRDYIYIPLGGNRKGMLRRYVNLMVTMLAGGIWHGAGWTFLIWGGLHGVYLCINHFFSYVTLPFKKTLEVSNLYKAISYFLTFISVCVAWVFFKAASLSSAFETLKGMASVNHMLIPMKWKPYLAFAAKFFALFHIRFGVIADSISVQQVLTVIMALLIVFVLPNTQEIMKKYDMVLEIDKYPSYSINKTSFLLEWKPTLLWSLVFGVMMALSILNLSHSSIFLYYQF